MGGGLITVSFLQAWRIKTAAITDMITTDHFEQVINFTGKRFCKGVLILFFLISFKFLSIIDIYLFSLYKAYSIIASILMALSHGR